MAKFLTYASGAMWWPKLELIQLLVAKFSSNKVTPVTDSMGPLPLAMFQSDAGVCLMVIVDYD